MRALADTEEQRLALLAENEKQRQVIAEFEPIKNYVDAILSCEGAMAVSQIAADYNISAVKLNRILHEAGLQYRVNDEGHFLNHRTIILETAVEVRQYHLFVVCRTYEVFPLFKEKMFGTSRGK